MPKAYQTMRWQTWDGEDFATEEEAKAHEEEHYRTALVGLSQEQVDKALARDPDVRAISDAFEKAGNLIAKARVAAGERRRARKGEGAAAETSTQPPTEQAPLPPSATSEPSMPDDDELPE